MGAFTFSPAVALLLFLPAALLFCLPSAGLRGYASPPRKKTHSSGAPLSPPPPDLRPPPTSPAPPSVRALLLGWKAGHDRRRLVELLLRSGAVGLALIALAAWSETTGLGLVGVLMLALLVEGRLAWGRRLDLLRLSVKVDEEAQNGGLFSTALSVEGGEARGEPDIQELVRQSALQAAPTSGGEGQGPVRLPRAYPAVGLLGLGLLLLRLITGTEAAPRSEPRGLTAVESKPGTPGAQGEEEAPEPEPSSASTKDPTGAGLPSSSDSRDFGGLLQALGFGEPSGDAAPSTRSTQKPDAPAAPSPEEAPHFGQDMQAGRDRHDHNEEGEEGGQGLAAASRSANSPEAQEPGSSGSKGPDLGAADPNGARTSPGELPPEAEKTAAETRSGEADEAATAKDGGEALSPPDSPPKTGLTSNAAVTAGTPSNSDEDGGEGPPGAGGVNDQAGSTEAIGLQDPRARRSFAEEQLRAAWRASPEGMLRDIEEGPTGGAARTRYAALFQSYQAIAESEAAENNLPQGREAFLIDYFDKIGPAPEKGP